MYSLNQFSILKNSIFLFKNSWCHPKFNYLYLILLFISDSMFFVLNRMITNQFFWNRISIFSFFFFAFLAFGLLMFWFCQVNVVWHKTLNQLNSLLIFVKWNNFIFLEVVSLCCSCVRSYSSTHFISILLLLLLILIQFLKLFNWVLIFW